MNTIFQNRSVRLWRATCSLLFITLLGVISCKGPANSGEPPLPQPTSVSISGITYPVVAIGNRVWTTTNYTGPGGIPYKGGTEKPEYGRYYTFEDVKAVSLPAGWRIPTIQDYIALAESQGVVFTNYRATRQQAIKALASKTNWRTISGTNSSGFNACPAGYSFQNSKPQDGDISEFWMADASTVSIQESGSGDAHTLMFYKNSDSNEYRFNVRFVKDK